MSNLFEPIKTSDRIPHDGLTDLTLLNQLTTRWQALSDESSSCFIVAETAFGQGLNFLLTWSLWREHAPKTAKLHFISCEKNPLTLADLTQCLALWPTLKTEAGALLQVYPTLTPGFHQLNFDEGRVCLTLMLGDALDCYRELLVCGDKDLEPQLRPWFIDAWFLTSCEQSLSTIIGLLSKPDTLLIRIEPGITSVSGLLLNPITSDTTRKTPWSFSLPYRPLKKKAIVLGAGLAGCYTAHALARRGWEVTLIDGEAEVGGGASGNRQAVLYPNLSAYRAPLTELMLAGFLFAVRAYQSLDIHGSIGNFSGLLQFMTLTPALSKWLKHYPALGRWVDVDEASVLAGISLQEGGVFVPDAGWIDLKALCQLLVQTPGVNWIPNTRVHQLSKKAGRWHVAGHQSEILVIANGYQATQFSETAHLPIQAVRGQMTMFKSNEQSMALNIPLCRDGHVLPVTGGSHAVGATYQLGRVDTAINRMDDNQNLDRLQTLPTTIVWSDEITGHWANSRATTHDHLPIVGPVVDALLFEQQFSSLAKDANRWIPNAGPYHEGLYVCAGFGSRGLTTIPLCGEYLAALINNEPTGLSRRMAQSLSPARFLHASCKVFKN